jgi:hypothetical protein
VVGTWRWSVRPGGVEAADVEEGGLSLGSGTPESVVVPAFEGQVHGVDGQLAPRCGQDREDVPLPVERIGGHKLRGRTGRIPRPLRTYQDLALHPQRQGSLASPVGFGPRPRRVPKGRALREHDLGPDPPLNPGSGGVWRPGRAPRRRRWTSGPRQGATQRRRAIPLWPDRGSAALAAGQTGTGRDDRQEDGAGPRDPGVAKVPGGA